MSVLTFVLAIVCLVLMISSTIVGSFCEFSVEILNETDFVSFLDRFNIQVEPKEVSFLNECLPENASGDILTVLEVPDFGDV